MEGYRVEVIESSIELNAREKIKIKDTSDSIALDKATQEGEVIICPKYWAVLGVHNDKSDNPDYTNYIVVDVTGLKYRTGSESFWSAFMNIWNELKEDTDDWDIKVYRLPSKNRSGKDFLTCSLI